MDLIKTVIEGCQIIREIGRGTMGVVYEARQTGLDRLVAIKFLAPHLCEDKEFCQRFLREARAVAKLNHHNVVQVHSVGQVKSQLYMITELVQGKSLKELMAEQGPMTEQRALDIIRQVTSALMEAERQHIVHRDIKPQNIMVTQDGTVKVMDFGLAKDLFQQELTMPGMLMGTPCYMSPEQIQGHEVDHRSDIYSLGLVLFYLLTGRNAFSGKNMAQVFNAHLSGRLPDITNFRTDISDCTKRLFERMADRNPGHRPASNAQLIQEIQTCLDIFKTEDDSSLAGSTITRSPAHTKRWGWIATVITLALISVMGAYQFKDRLIIHIPWQQTISTTADKPSNTPISLHDYLTKGQALLKAHRFDQALNTFKRAAKQYPGEAEIAMWIQLALKAKASSIRDAVLKDLSDPPKLSVLLLPYSKFTFKNQRGRWEGLNVEILEGFCKKYGLEFRPVPVENFKKLIPQLLNGPNDIIGAPFTITEARKAQIAFSTPYFTNTEVLVIQANAPITSIEDLEGRTMGYLPGTTLEKTTLSIRCKRRIPFKDTNAMAEALSRKKIDAFVDDFSDALLLATAYRDVAIGPQMAQVEYYGFSMKKGKLNLKNYIDKYIKEIKSSGEYKRIYGKYFQALSVTHQPSQ